MAHNKAPGHKARNRVPDSPCPQLLAHRAHSRASCCKAYSGVPGHPGPLKGSWLRVPTIEVLANRPTIVILAVRLTIELLAHQPHKIAAGQKLHQIVSDEYSCLRAFPHFLKMNSFFHWASVSHPEVFLHITSKLPRYSNSTTGSVDDVAKA
jgi:hypothetical protein